MRDEDGLRVRVPPLQKPERTPLAWGFKAFLGYCVLLLTISFIFNVFYRRC